MNVIGTRYRESINSGLNKWTPPRKSGGIPRLSTRFSLGMENEQTDAGQDGQTRLARRNFQARRRTGKYSFCLVQTTTSRIGNLTWLILTLLYVITIHTYIHTWLQQIANLPPLPHLHRHTYLAHGNTKPKDLVCVKHLLHYLIRIA